VSWWQVCRKQQLSSAAYSRASDSRQFLKRTTTVPKRLTAGSKRRKYLLRLHHRHFEKQTLQISRKFDASLASMTTSHNLFTAILLENNRLVLVTLHFPMLRVQRQAAGNDRVWQSCQSTVMEWWKARDLEDKFIKLSVRTSEDCTWKKMYEIKTVKRMKSWKLQCSGVRLCGQQLIRQSVTWRACESILNHNTNPTVAYSTAPLYSTVLLCVSCHWWSLT